MTEDWQLAAIGGLIESAGLRELVERDENGLMRLGLDRDSVDGIVERTNQSLESDLSNSLIRESAATVLAASGSGGQSRLLDLLRTAPAPELARHILGLLIDSALGIRQECDSSSRTSSIDSSVNEWNSWKI